MNYEHKFRYNLGIAYALINFDETDKILIMIIIQLQSLCYVINNFFFI